MLEIFHLPAALSSSDLYRAVYDPVLVTLSVLMAVIASYGAQRVSLTIRSATRKMERMGLLLAGALSLGGGIWAMHFIGMLAFSLPCGVRYDLGITLLSMLPGVLAGGVALLIISRPTIGWPVIVAGGTVLGTGIGMMHYSGMAALRMDAILRYDPLLFGLSVVVAVLLAILALGVPHWWRRRQSPDSEVPDLLGAVVMGGAISGMHYMAMQAAYFLRNGIDGIVTEGVNPGLLALVIVTATVLLVGAVILGSMAHRYREMALSVGAANERLRQSAKALDTTIESVTITGPDRRILAVNPSFTRITGYSEAEALGRNPRFLQSGRHDRAYYQDMWRAIEQDGHWQGEIWNRRKSGEIYPQWLTISAIKDDAGTVQSYVAVASDISSIKQQQEELARLLRQNRAILDSAGEGILGIGTGGEVVFLNPAGTAMLGWSQEELAGRNAHAVIHHTRADGSACPSADCPVSKVLGDGQPRKVTNDCFWRKDGSGFAVEYMVAPVVADQTVTGAVILFRDITERQLQESRMRLAARVFECSPDGIVITDRHHRILSANQAFLDAFRYSAEELQGCRPATLLTGTTHWGQLRQALKTITSQGSWETEAVARRHNGDIFPARIRISTDHDAAGAISHYIGIVSDQSAAKSAEDRIEYLSRYDSLTALPNLRMLKDYFDIARGSAERSQSGMGLILCNLDNFKHINDTLGHAAGDELLREIARRLMGCVAIGTGDIVCRTSGDEFLVLLVDVPEWDAVQISIHAMRAVVAVPVALEPCPVSVTASFGVSRYPDDGEDFDTLFRKADAAGYHAKLGGRNTVRFFTSSMIDYATERLVMKNDLRHAIENNELFLHYQPLVDLGSGGIVGAEALVRWQSPVHGFVSPVRFIPIAEESGLIVPIGEWVLREVCRQGQRWRQAGLPSLRLAVNISAIQLHSLNFVETVKQVVEESGLPPQWLELELTESVLISEVEQTLEIINELKRFGFHLAIDDFGTGYSCLSYLQRLKTDKLKIDRSFVSGLTINPESDAIVNTILQMAQTMNMITLAEGVETEAQAEFLKSRNCRECQGYLFGRPVPAEEFSRMVTSQTLPAMIGSEPVPLRSLGRR